MTLKCVCYIYARYSVLKNKQDFTSFNNSISLLRTYVRSQRSRISAINLSSLKKTVQCVWPERELEALDSVTPRFRINLL